MEGLEAISGPQYLVSFSLVGGQFGIYGWNGGDGTVRGLVGG